MKTALPFLHTILAAMLLLIVYSCSCEEDEPPQPPPRPSSYLSDYSLSATHTKGTSACPQFVDLVDVYCSPSASGACTADSVVISNPNPGLTTLFANGNATSSTLPTDPLSATYFSLEFNCSVPQTINHTYVLIFYKDGT